MAAPGFLEAMTPWSSRTATPQPKEKHIQEKRSAPSTGQKQGGDHRINPRHRLNHREYPDDTPNAKIRWFFSESAKRKPDVLCKPGDRARPPAPPKKFVAFSAKDSRSIETTFQRLAEDEEKIIVSEHALNDTTSRTRERHDSLSRDRDSKQLSPEAASGPGGHQSVLVPVNEDFLFDVDVDARELAPAYWLGPIYEIRRGTWFYQDGASSRPCDENLATQLEEGYIKTKPWRNQTPDSLRSTSGSRSRPTSWKPLESREKGSGTSIDIPRAPSVDDAFRGQGQDDLSNPSAPPKFQLQTHRLFGAHMNSVVTYQDATVAWMLTDDFLSRMSSSVYQRFAGGGHLGGVKVVRGFVESTSSREQKADAVLSVQEDVGETRGRSPASHKQQSAPGVTERPRDIGVSNEKLPDAESDTRRQELERRMETIVNSPGLPDPIAEEEEVRKREEAEIKEDYREADGEEQGREIDHLVFVTHGIGQRLGLKMESLNFIHDVNILRKTLKSVYDNSQDLQALNSEVGHHPKNCRVQVLPVVWRHLLDFPRPASGTQRREQDLSDANASGDDQAYPSLNDITVDGVPAIRNLVEDLFLDILLYQSAYREHIADIVQRECNRVFELFQARNPLFKGKVSFVGHSLGSAIMFDLLCWQRESDLNVSSFQGSKSTRRASYQRNRDDSKDFSLHFEVEDFYCLGSPIGLFQMIKGRTIRGRKAGDVGNAKDCWDLQMSGLTSSPKCQQIFNIFHPTDPVAYRLEPLISPAMKHLKPQPLPYVKRGIFRAPAIGLTGIGARVGQSVSGLWSNITSGVASSLLNKSLGLSSDSQVAPGQPKKQFSMAGAIDAVGADEAGAQRNIEKDSSKESAQPGIESGSSVQQPAISDEPQVETLYTGFKRHQSGSQADGRRPDIYNQEWEQAEAKARQLRIEEAKIRGLNRNGRIDYSIQE